MTDILNFRHGDGARSGECPGRPKTLRDLELDDGTSLRYLRQGAALWQ